MRMKRKLAALLLIGALAGAGQPAQAATPGWTHDGYGPGNTGYNPAESTVNSSTIKKLKLKWRAVPDEGSEGCFEQVTPVAADGRVFFRDGDGVGAVDLKSGKWLWSNTTVMDSDVHRTLTVAGGLLITTGYSCYGVSDPSGHIVALDVKTGKVKWSILELSATEHVLVDKNILVSYSVCEVCDSYGVTAYRLSDGAELWSRDGQLASPVSANGRLLLAEPDGSGAVAVSVKNGKALWYTGNAWSALAANPAGDQFYVTGFDNELAAVSAATGKVLWSVPDAAGSLAADGTRVYVSQFSGMTAYSAKNGNQLWHRGGVWSDRPVRAGGLLYVTGSILSPVNGALVMNATYSGDYHHAVVVGGRVLRVKGYEIQAYGL
ncbi:PQQ-binding-like beta-propeller repeat protein [Actinoplanes sp. N902-109]|uniref:outer membrane protein assembly factor BamB family protein n=1 Tax=Actinoplanes sp. (strain N902-109) TaxID=649831 RepID=UPI00032942E1|nr:PQQ-binding-like beta-propeller repeat protein [Actinoplanes sp. N902-109]AGL14269.1 outer membrane biogenesis protein BamB [Actinoplanes sp. N902-109]